MCYFRVLGFFCKHSVQWDRVRFCPDFLNSSQLFECQLRHPVGEIVYEHGYSCKQCPQQPLIGERIVRQPQSGNGGTQLLSPSGHSVTGRSNDTQRSGGMGKFRGLGSRTERSENLGESMNPLNQISRSSATSYSGSGEIGSRDNGDPLGDYGEVGGREESFQQKIILGNEIHEVPPSQPVSKAPKQLHQRQSQMPSGQTSQTLQLQQRSGGHQGPHYQQPQQLQRPASQIPQLSQQSRGGFGDHRYQHQHQLQLQQLARQNGQQLFQYPQSQNGFRSQIPSQLQTQQLQRSTGKPYDPSQEFQQQQQPWQEITLSHQRFSNCPKSQNLQYPTKRKSKEEQTTPRRNNEELQQGGPKRRRTGTASITMAPRATPPPSLQQTPFNALPPPRACGSMATTPMSPLTPQKPLSLQAQHSKPTGKNTPRNARDSSTHLRNDSVSSVMTPQVMYPIQMSSRETLQRQQPTLSTSQPQPLRPSFKPFYASSEPTPYFQCSKDDIFSQSEAAVDQGLNHHAILDSLMKVRSDEVSPSLSDPASIELYKRSLGQERASYQQEMSESQTRSKDLLKELVRSRSLGNVQFWLRASQTLRELEGGQKNQRLKELGERRKEEQRLKDIRWQQESQIFVELEAGLIN